MAYTSNFTWNYEKPQAAVVEAIGTNSETTSFIFSPGIDAQNRASLFQEHHLVTTGVANKREILPFLNDLTTYGSYRHNDFSSNGVFLPQKSADALRLGVVQHSGSHPAYDQFIEKRTLLTRISTRLLKLLTHHSAFIEEHELPYLDADPALAPLHAAAGTYRIALCPRAGQKVLTWERPLVASGQSTGTTTTGLCQ